MTILKNAHLTKRLMVIFMESKSVARDSGWLDSMRYVIDNLLDISNEVCYNYLGLEVSL